jgi:hypothetical protein
MIKFIIYCKFKLLKISDNLKYVWDNSVKIELLNTQLLSKVLSLKIYLHV